MDNGHFCLFVFQLPTTVSARVLLSHYKWDTQSLIDNYYDTDQDQFFQQANLSNPFKAQLTSITDDSDECKICYSDDTSEVSMIILFKFYLDFLIK